jgi:hypothetical protein
MNTGTTEITLGYPDGLVDTGEFWICVTAPSDNQYTCANAYNSGEERSENVKVDLFGEFRYYEVSGSSFNKQLHQVLI